MSCSSSLPIFSVYPYTPTQSPSSSPIPFENHNKYSNITTPEALDLIENAWSTNLQLELPFTPPPIFSDSISFLPPENSSEKPPLTSSISCLIPEANHKPEFEKYFKNKAFLKLQKASSVNDFKNILRLFLIDYFFDYKNGSKRPECILNLWQDLREKPLLYIKNKYFSYNLTNHSELPVFMSTISEIFNNQYLELDISGLLQQENIELITDIKERQLSNKVVKKDEALRLMLYKRNLNAHVITNYDLSSFLNSIDTKTLPRPYRIQFIIRSINNHYTGLDLEYTQDGQWISFIMDASQSLEVENIKTALKKSKINTIIEAYCPTIKDEVKLLQSDNHSCWLFSLDHIIQSSKINNLFEFLNSKIQVVYGEESYLPFVFLPAEFIRNAQSTKILFYYSQINPEEWKKKYKGDIPFEKYIQRHIKTIKINGKSNKLINTHATSKAQAYKDEAIFLLDTLPIEEIIAITQPNTQNL